MRELFFYTLRLKLFIFFSVLLPSYSCYANYIYGATVGMKQLDLGGFKFEVKVRIYVDINKLTLIDQDYLEIGNHDMQVFRKSDNKAVSYFYLSFRRYDDIVYAKKGCADSLGLSVRAFTYDAVVTLNPADYEDKDGYYMIWDRCCRNQGVTNIANSELANMLLEAELPRLSVNGQPVAFSLPEFPVFSGGIACNGKSFTYNFQANDSDGDQLTYRLVEPLKGFTTINNPIGFPQPGPYQTLPYATGYSITNLIPSKNPVTIGENTGILSMNPNQIGSYSIAVICEKYRNGEKIGSVRHEFQIPVTNCISDAVPIISNKGNPVQKLSLCLGDSILLTTNNSNNWLIQWERDQKPLLNAIGTGIWVSQPGIYRVRKESSKGCISDTVSKDVLVERYVPSDVPKISTSSKNLCEGESITLTTTLLTSFTIAWYRQNILLSNQASLTVDQPGTYVLMATMTNGSCRFPSDSLNLNQVPAPQLPQPVSLETCPQDTFQLQVPNQVGWTYQWYHNGNIVGLTSTIMAKDSGIYNIKVKNEYNCITLSLPYRISYRSDCLPTTIFIPSVFTPNGDGINDIWEIKNISQYPQIEISVFNRWGGKIFTSTKSMIFWDGKYEGDFVDVGVFVYQIQTSPGGIVYKGYVTVLR